MRGWVVLLATATAFAAPVAHAQIPPLNVHVVANWDEHSPAHIAADLWADEFGYAYVCSRFAPSIDIMDVSDPVYPRLVTTYEVGPPNNFANGKDVKVAAGLMFIGLDDDGNDGVEIVDVRDPRDPRFLANIRIGGFADVHNLFYDSGLLYLADSRDPVIAVIDLRTFDPENPPAQTITQADWLIENVGSVFVHDITVVDGRLYAAAWDSGLWVYDISEIDTAGPVFLASAPGNNTHSAWPTADKRWIVANEERTDGGPVKLYEMLAAPGSFTLELRDTFSIPVSDAPASHNVYVVGYRAYCAWYNRGLMAFDIDPIEKRLTLVAHFDTSVTATTFHGAWGVFPFFGRDKVMVSDKETQFWIFDVRVPASGDFNGDADVDLDDFAARPPCRTAPNAHYTDPACEVFDFDNDFDVDFADYAAMQRLSTGPR